MWRNKKQHYLPAYVVMSGDPVKIKLIRWLTASLYPLLGICQLWERLWEREKHHIWRLIGVLRIWFAFLITTMLPRHFQLWRNRPKDERKKKQPLAIFQLQQMWNWLCLLYRSWPLVIVRRTDWLRRLHLCCLSDWCLKCTGDDIFLAH